jgi:hypothetical protein
MSDAVEMFVAARRPFFAELRVVTRRRGVDASRVGQLYETSTGLLDRLLLAFVAAHAATTAVAMDGGDGGAAPTAGSA